MVFGKRFGALCERAKTRALYPNGRGRNEHTVTRSICSCLGSVPFALGEPGKDAEGG